MSYRVQVQFVRTQPYADSAARFRTRPAAEAYGEHLMGQVGGVAHRVLESTDPVTSTHLTVRLWERKCHVQDPA